jgi:CMP-N-acetylneuraminic acid synthetase
MTESVLAVIPVRSGSKRLPGKNVAELDGKPLLAHTIEQADDATHVDEHVVSTDSSEFKRIARDHGGNVPFDRPPELATDDATNKDVLEHVLDWYSDRGSTFDIAVMLQVTSPFRTADDIDEAVQLLVESDGNSVVSTTKYDTPPFWAVQTNDSDRFLRPYFGDEYLWSKTQTQSIPTLTHPNGAIYAIEVDTFRRQLNFYTDRTLEYHMPRERSLDIDEPFDLKLAQGLAELEES